LKKLDTWELRWWAERCEYIGAELKKMREREQS
jgi:hypothetical protein